MLVVPRHASFTYLRGESRMEKFHRSNTPTPARAHRPVLLTSDIDLAGLHASAWIHARSHIECINLSSENGK